MKSNKISQKISQKNRSQLGNIIIREREDKNLLFLNLFGVQVLKTGLNG